MTNKFIHDSRKLGKEHVKIGEVPKWILILEELLSKKENEALEKES